MYAVLFQVRVPHKRAAPKQKKQKRRKNKSKRRRKCKKHAKTDAPKTSSSISLTCTSDAASDVKSTNDATSGEDARPADFGVTVNKIRSSGKGIWETFMYSLTVQYVWYAGQSDYVQVTVCLQLIHCSCAISNQVWAQQNMIIWFE